MFMQREADTAGSFTQVGHNPLLGRGMNAAIAVHKRYVYVGSRTDGKNNNANHAGIMIVDAQDPADPKLVARDGPARGGPPGRVLARAARLALAEHPDRAAHQLRRRTARTSARANSRSTMRFYDIAGANATNPELLYQNTLRHARVLHLGGPDEPASAR